MPFATAWMGENHFAAVPTAMYGVVLLMSGLAWKNLPNALISHDTPDSKLRTAVGSDLKGRLSLSMDAAAIPLAFVHQLADALYVTVSLMWLIPDRRMERMLAFGAHDADRPTS
jgi:uncharacterized membrane protein